MRWSERSCSGTTSSAATTRVQCQKQRPVSGAASSIRQQQRPRHDDRAAREGGKPAAANRERDRGVRRRVRVDLVDARQQHARVHGGAAEGDARPDAQEPAEVGARARQAEHAGAHDLAGQDHAGHDPGGARDDVRWRVELHAVDGEHLAVALAHDGWLAARERGPRREGYRQRQANSPRCDLHSQAIADRWVTAVPDPT
eukprot:1430225-Prymnesium_polylepis.1